MKLLARRVFVTLIITGVVAVIVMAMRPQPVAVDLAEICRGPLVVKDFGNKSVWVRWIGRIQISRECRAYGWLGPMSGVARLVGRVDSHALALEFIEGQELARSPQRFEHRAEYLSRIKEIVSAKPVVGGDGLCREIAGSPLAFPQKDSPLIMSLWFQNQFPVRIPGIHAKVWHNNNCIRASNHDRD